MIKTAGIRSRASSILEVAYTWEHSLFGEKSCLANEHMARVTSQSLAGPFKKIAAFFSPSASPGTTATGLSKKWQVVWLERLKCSSNSRI